MSLMMLCRQFEIAKEYTFFGVKFLGLKFAFCKPMTFHKSEWQYFDLTWDLCSAELPAIWLAGNLVYNSVPSILHHSRCKHSLETLGKAIWPGAALSSQPGS